MAVGNSKPGAPHLFLTPSWGPVGLNLSRLCKAFRLPIMNPEADLMETASIQLLSQSCRNALERLFREEEAQDDVQVNRDGYWASRQFSEFNIWCAKVGINGQGLQSIDVRLKDVPEICEMIIGLLQSLDQDLKQMQEPGGMAIDNITNHDGIDSSDSDSSSLWFDSLSSISQTEAEISIDNGNVAEKQIFALQGHIEETIDRLHGHAFQIDRVGDRHRKERLKVYMRKESSKIAYNGYLELAYRKAKLQFQDATEIFQRRMAESVARRRIRFDFLRKHQQKRAIEAAGVQQTSVIQAMSFPERGDPIVSQPLPTHGLDAPLNADLTARWVEDMRTVYSAMEHTKLEISPQSRRQERAESVASVALRHVEFPSRPQVIGGSFQCPYCRLDFGPSEAQPSRWSQHVMQDFEPYFCILEHCQAPFDIPNTFDGLLMHLQEHMEARFHVDLPSGGHEIFDEQGLEAHLIEHGASSLEELYLMKEASRRKSVLIIESCPFCGGYPDDIEEKYTVSNSHEAQMELRKHIKRHMHDIALLLPPYRHDIFNKNDVSDAVTECYLALEKDDKDIIRKLLEHGVDVTSQNFEGKTALEIATEKGHQVISNLLSGKSHLKTDTSSHDHSMARHSNNYPTNSWLQESFLQTVNNAERIAAGAPRPGIGILGIELLDTYINHTPTMHSARDALPVFDHSSASSAPRYLGWRQAQRVAEDISLEAPKPQASKRRGSVS